MSSSLADRLAKLGLRPRSENGSMDNEEADASSSGDRVVELDLLDSSSGLENISRGELLRAPVPPPSVPVSSLLGNPVSVTRPTTATAAMADNGDETKSAQTTSFSLSASDDIRALIFQKEKELHDISDYRLRTLEKAIADKESEISLERNRFSKLKEDFQYNLKLIEDRDAELSRYDQTFEQLKGLLRDKESELSEMKMRETEFESAIRTEKAKFAEQEDYFKEKLKDMRSAMENAKWTAEDYARRQQDAFDAARRDLERQLRAKEEETEAQRREASDTLDEIVRRRELDFRKKEEELASQLRHASNSRSNATRDLENAHVTIQELQRQLEGAQSAAHDAAKEAKSATWQLDDVRRLKDAEIEALQADKNEMVNVKQQLLDEYEGKMGELLASLHSVERAFAKQKEAYEAQIYDYEKKKEAELAAASQAVEKVNEKLAESEDKISTITSEFKKAKWEYEDQLAIKDRELERAQQASKESSARQNARSEDKQDRISELEDEVTGLKKALIDAKSESQRFELDAQKLRGDLKVKSDAYEELAKSSASRDLARDTEWSSREAELVKIQDERNASLQQQRDQLESELREAEAHGIDLEGTVSSLRKELHRANEGLRASAASKDGEPLFEGDMGPPSPLASLQSSAHTLPFPSTSPQRASGANRPPFFPPENAAKIKALGEENERLTLALAEMRGEMEHLHRRQANAPVPKKEIVERTVYVAANDADDPFLKSLLDSRQDIVKELDEAHEYARVLQRKLDGTAEPDEEVSSLRAQVDTLHAKLRQARDNIVAAHRATSEISTKLKAAEDAAASQSKSEECQTLEESMSQIELRGLREELERAKDDAGRLQEERDKLIEVSNKLRASLNQTVSKSIEGAPFGGAVGGALIAERSIEKKIALKYKDKVARIEASLERLVEQNRTLKMKLLKGDANAAIRRGSLAGMLEHSNDDDAERSNHDHDSEAKHETRMASRAKRSRRRRKAERDAELDVESLVRRRREARRVAADHLSKGMPDGPVLQQRSADRSAGDADLSSGAISASLDIGNLSSISKREGEKDETDDEDELPLTIPTEYPDHDGASFKTSSDERRLRARRRLAAGKEKLELSGKQIAPSI